MNIRIPPGLAAWWQQRNASEQRTLTLGGLALLLLLVVTEGALPLWQAHQRLAQALPLARGTLQVLASQAAEARALRGEVPVSGTARPAGPVQAGTVEQAVRAAGLPGTVQTVRPGAAGTLEITLAQTGLDEVLAWVGQASRDLGVRLQRLDASVPGAAGSAATRDALPARDGRVQVVLVLQLPRP